MSPELYQSLAAASNGVFKEHGAWWVVAERAPTDRVREALRERLKTIQAALDDRGEAAVLIAVNDVVMSLDRKTSSDSGFAAQIRSYVELLKDSPPWAVAKASDEFRRGTAVHHHNPAFMPSTAEFCRQVEYYLDHWRDERRKLESVVQSRIYHAPDKPPPGHAEEVLTQTIPRNPVTGKLTPSPDSFEAQRVKALKEGAAFSILLASEDLRRRELETIGVDPDVWKNSAALWLDQHPAWEAPKIK